MSCCLYCCVSLFSSNSLRTSQNVKLFLKRTKSETEKDIVPEPVEPGGVHPELGGQVDSQRESAVHGVVEESPAQRGESALSAVFHEIVIF